MTQHGANTLDDTSEPVPREVVESILRDRLADPTATLTSLDAQPFANDGASGNNTLYRAKIAWTAREGMSPESTEWIIKRWQPGGQSEEEMGHDLPVEALAWQHGLLRPQMLPAGVTTPFIGASLGPDENRAWVAMTDVPDDLAQVSFGNPLPPEEAVERVRMVLGGLARFHAWWEQPKQQEKLPGYSWLLPWENKVWRDAAKWAQVLGDRQVMGPVSETPVTERSRFNIQSFLDWLPRADRQLWEDLGCDRRRLVSALRTVPRTLLHGDPGPRNSGLRWPQGQAGVRGDIAGSPELVLIDWEWCGKGAAALDVAPVWMKLPLICDPSQPLPEACWSYELPDYYFDCYGSAGGTQIDLEGCRRSCDLALAAWWVVDGPTGIGAAVRAEHGVGRRPRNLAGVSEEAGMALLRAILGWAPRTNEKVTRALREWLA